jgi:hypothetical protein
MVEEGGDGVSGGSVSAAAAEPDDAADEHQQSLDEVC